MIPTEAPSQLTLTDVSMQYDADLGSGRYAVQSVSCSVRQGHTLCLIGHSGCGKSSVIRMIAGLEEPISGRITLDGVPVANTPSADRVMVFQRDAVFPWMTVSQNIGYPLRMAGIDRDERLRRVEYFIELVGLEQYADAWPKQLSGGMRKRVDVARAYAANPKVLLMDEPFGSLDVMTKEHLQVEYIRLRQSEPKTTVFVTHDLEEAVFLGDDVAVMDKGTLRDIIPIPFERERPLSLKRDPRFSALIDRLAAALDMPVYE